VTAAALPRAASRQALAVLRHPDRRTTWAIVLAASLDVARRPSQDRVDALHAELPIIGARLDGEVWVPGGPPRVVDVGSHEPTEAPDLLDGFSLDRDAPLRVVVGGVGGGRVALVGHHAAFDGRGLVAVLGALLGGDIPNSVAGVSPGRLRPQLATVRRLVRPADRIAPSRVAPARDSVVARDAVLGGHDVTARLAAA